MRSYINSTHWLADGRFLLAPIEYEDAVMRSADGLWRIASREIVVWRWWVTEGYAPRSDRSRPGPTLHRSGVMVAAERVVDAYHHLWHREPLDRLRQPACRDARMPRRAEPRRGHQVLAGTATRLYGL